MLVGRLHEAAEPEVPLPMHVVVEPLRVEEVHEARWRMRIDHHAGAVEANHVVPNVAGRLWRVTLRRLRPIPHTVPQGLRGYDQVRPLLRNDRRAIVGVHEAEGHSTARAVFKGGPNRAALRIRPTCLAAIRAGPAHRNPKAVEVPGAVARPITENLGAHVIDEG